MSCGKNKQLDVYSCDPPITANACNDLCVLEKNMKYSFLVNKEEKSVLQVVFWEGKQEGSLIHKNCTIFDEKNWDCSEISTLTYVTTNRHLTMANGIFSHTHELTDNVKGNLRNPEQKGTCAK